MLPTSGNVIRCFRFRMQVRGTIQYYLRGHFVFVKGTQVQTRLVFEITPILFIFVDFWPSLRCADECYADTDLEVGRCLHVRLLWWLLVPRHACKVGSVFFAECGMRNAEFRSRVFCGNLDAECSANYTLFEFSHCIYLCVYRADRSTETGPTIKKPTDISDLETTTRT